MVYEREDIIELVENWVEKQNPPYRQTDFTSAKSYHPNSSTIVKYCGGWYDVLNEIGAETGKYSKEYVIEKMKKLDDETDGVVTQKQIRDSDEISMGIFYTVFDSLPEFRKEHDLETNDRVQKMIKTEKDIFKENKKKMLERDNYKCQDCGKKQSELKKSLSAHHKIEKKAFKNPKTAHRVDNLISLCNSCHAERHNSKNGFKSQTA